MNEELPQWTPPKTSGEKWQEEQATQLINLSERVLEKTNEPKLSLGAALDLQKQEIMELIGVVNVLLSDSRDTMESFSVVVKEMDEAARQLSFQSGISVKLGVALKKMTDKCESTDVEIGKQMGEIEENIQQNTLKIHELKNAASDGVNEMRELKKRRLEVQTAVPDVVQSIDEPLEAVPVGTTTSTKLTRAEQDRQRRLRQKKKREEEAQSTVQAGDELTDEQEFKDTPVAHSAGEFVVGQSFKPGRRAGALVGEFITPATLYKYMKRWRKLLGKGDVCSFSPTTEGYIPFFTTEDGLVWVPGGVSIKDIEAGKKWVFKRAGSMCTFTNDMQEQIYRPANAKRLSTIASIEQQNATMSQLSEQIRAILQQEQDAV